MQLGVGCPSSTQGHFTLIDSQPDVDAHPSLFLGTLVSRPQMGRQDRRRSMRGGHPRLEDAPFPGTSESSATLIRLNRVRPREPTPQREEALVQHDMASGDRGRRKLRVLGRNLVGSGSRRAPPGARGPRSVRGGSSPRLRLPGSRRSIPSVVARAPSGVTERQPGRLLGGRRCTRTPPATEPPLPGSAAATATLPKLPRTSSVEHLAIGPQRAPAAPIGPDGRRAATPGGPFALDTGDAGA